MITVGMHYEVVPEKDRDFEQAFDEILVRMANAQGHDSTNLYREVRVPAAFLVLSRWESEDAYHAFVRSEAFDRVLEGAGGKILAARPHHRIYYA